MSSSASPKFSRVSLFETKKSKQFKFVTCLCKKNNKKTISFAMSLTASVIEKISPIINKKKCPDNQDFIPTTDKVLD